MNSLRLHRSLSVSVRDFWIPENVRERLSEKPEINKKGRSGASMFFHAVSEPKKS
jgi:hypothetical protein